MGYFRSAFPELTHVPCIPITGLSREGGARVLAQSAVYAAFPHLESLGLMCLEAMACGCHVVGYTGGGGTEYANDGNGFWIEESGDHHKTFSKRIKKALDLVSAGETEQIRGGLKTARQYSRPAFSASVREAYGKILGQQVDDFRLEEKPVEGAKH